MHHPIDADVARCRDLLRGGSRTFYAASFLLPRHLRSAATALYAFCRVADDAVDNGGGTGALDELRERLDRMYRGVALDLPEDRAFAHVTAAHAIPRAVPEALLEGLAWDVCERRYETLEDVRAYGARVAGTVGVMMTLVMNARAPRLVARAAELGVAMQLSNIARDVGEDARNGRLYLPRTWLEDVGIDADAFLHRPRFSPALAAVVQRLLDEAEDLYLRADSGIHGLPPSCRFGIGAARTLYAEIGHEVARRNYDSISSRAVVTPARKLALLSATAAWYLPGGSQREFEAVDQIRFLVEAVAMTAPRPRPQPEMSGANLAGAFIRTLELFERLERRDREARLQSG